MSNSTQNPEIWKDIPGFEGYYEASSFGRIKRVKTTKGTRAGKILKQGRGTSGYLGVALSVNCKPKTYMVHRLIALTFLDNPENKEQVNHISGDKHDNRAANLEFVTPVENMAHAYENGIHNQDGENNPHSKLTIDDVREIRRLRGNGVNGRIIAARYNINLRTVYTIANRKSWRHIE